MPTVITGTDLIIDGMSVITTTENAMRNDPKPTVRELLLDIAAALEHLRLEPEDTYQLSIREYADHHVTLWRDDRLIKASAVVPITVVPNKYDNGTFPLAFYIEITPALAPVSQSILIGINKPHATELGAFLGRGPMWVEPDVATSLIRTAIAAYTEQQRDQLLDVR